VGTEPEVDLPRGIGAPATRALVGAGYTSLDALAGVPAADLARLHGVGPRALKVLREELEKQGRSLS
jgi:predicted flap endonuclease-1-like 5' DNA nuclease